MTTTSIRFGVMVWLSMGALIGTTSCAIESPAEDDDQRGGELVQGVDRSGLWQSRTVAYCFERPSLGAMPSSVRSVVPTQAELDRRWGIRKQEFIGAVNVTWGAAGVLDLVALDSCASGAAVIRYDQDTPTGGFAGIGRLGGLSTGIRMDSEFLGSRYAWGNNTYHTYVAAHELGHTLGFKHEQDRTDSPCRESQDFSGTGIPLTGYDAASIMNYCNTQTTRLSELDKQGFARAYSFVSGGTTTCSNNHSSCSQWAAAGECSKNPGYMLTNCCASCSSGVRLISANGKCLDVRGAGTADGTNIQLYSCNGTGAQSFRREDVGGGASRLVNSASNKCVDVNGAGTADGTNIQLYSCNGTGAQSFALQDAGNGYVWLVNSNSGKCVDVAASGTADGTNIQLWTCNGTNAQRWRAVP